VLGSVQGERTWPRLPREGSHVRVLASLACDAILQGERSRLLLPSSPEQSGELPALPASHGAARRSTARRASGLALDQSLLNLGVHRAAWEAQPHICRLYKRTSSSCCVQCWL
jgi:hypothetical protein